MSALPAKSRHQVAEPATTLMKSRRRTRPSSERLRTTPVFKAYQIRAAMSALGQKQTCAVQTGMSALPPIATSNATCGMSAKDEKRTSGRLQALRKVSNHSRQSHLDFGELAGLRLDLD